MLTQIQFNRRLGTWLDIFMYMLSGIVANQWSLLRMSDYAWWNIFHSSNGEMVKRQPFCSGLCSVFFPELQRNCSHPLYTSCSFTPALGLEELSLAIDFYMLCYAENYLVTSSILNDTTMTTMLKPLVNTELPCFFTLLRCLDSEW